MGELFQPETMADLWLFLRDGSLAEFLLRFLIGWVALVVVAVVVFLRLAIWLGRYLARKSPEVLASRRVWSMLALGAFLITMFSSLPLGLGRALLAGLGALGGVLAAGTQAREFLDEKDKKNDAPGTAEAK